MDEPMAKNMSFQREYAEPYEWVAQQFKDWAFTLTTAFFYYNDYDFMGEDERGLHRKESLKVLPPGVCLVPTDTTVKLLHLLR